MKIKEIQVSKLKENSWNPNKLTGLKFDALVSQVKKYGMRQPLLVRKKAKFYEIIDGEHRFKASKQAGLKSVSCVVVDLNDKEAKAATIAMNNIKGKFDDLPLATLIAELNKGSELKELEELLAFNERELQYYLKLLESPEDLSKSIEVTEDPLITLTFLVSPQDEAVVNDALVMIDGAESKSEALVLLCRQKLKGFG